MGYRNRVAYGMGFETREKAFAFLCSFRLGLEGKELDAFDDIRQNDYGLHMNKPQYDGEGCLVTGYEPDVKWDESGIEEQMVKKMLKEARLSGASTAFLRMGDESGDCEEDYYEAGEDSDCKADIMDNHPLQHLHDDMYLVQKIHISNDERRVQLCQTPELANKEAENGTT